jgi:hypothetical protein
MESKMKNRTPGKFFAATMIAAMLAGVTASAYAETAWQKAHPRRTQVNSRLNNQNARIHQEVKNGEISKGQAANLHRQDRQIRGEERAMASQNGGHITKGEQRVLNKQENGVSREIGK